MAGTPLTASLAAEFSDVPPSPVHSAVRVVQPAPGQTADPTAVERTARADVAALAEALRRSPVLP
jgi:hypothetical protein